MNINKYDFNLPVVPVLCRPGMGLQPSLGKLWLQPSERRRRRSFRGRRF